MKLTLADTGRLLDELVDEETVRHYGSSFLAAEIAGFGLGISDGDVVLEDAEGFLVLETPAETIDENIRKVLEARAKGIPLYRVLDSGEVRRTAFEKGKEGW